MFFINISLFDHVPVKIKNGSKSKNSYFKDLLSVGYPEVVGSWVVDSNRVMKNV